MIMKARDSFLQRSIPAFSLLFVLLYLFISSQYFTGCKWHYISGKDQQVEINRFTQKD